MNQGTPTSGEEFRNADTLLSVITAPGIDVQRYEAAPGRSSLVARIEGTDPAAPSLCLNGHTDVVPVNESEWREDPFGGDLIDGEIWGRGAIDMLNLTASMAIALRHLADQSFRPRGTLVFFAVADEEAGSAYGARWMADHHPEDIRTDFLLTEHGGIHLRSAPHRVQMLVAEKGVAWRRLLIRGRSGHGSRPYGADNALVKAAQIVRLLDEYRPSPVVGDLWKRQVMLLDVEDSLRDMLLDPTGIDSALESLKGNDVAGLAHACTHTTVSPNVLRTQDKINVIPDAVSIDVDIRTLPGEDSDEVAAHLRYALGDLADEVEIEVLIDDPASASSYATPLWESLRRCVQRQFPGTELEPQLGVGFTDARVHRELGAVCYGAGLMSPSLELGEFAKRFHGPDERVDLESLGMTTQLWVDVAMDMLG